jgi:hypothetical protein
MKPTGENRSTPGETRPNAALSPQITHGLARDRTLTSAVGDQRLTA